MNCIFVSTLQTMSFQETKDKTLQEIVHVIEDWTDRDKQQLLRQLKMKRELHLARKIDKSAKGKKSRISDLEIASIVHDFRTGK